MMVIHLESGTVRNELGEITRIVEHPRRMLAAGAAAGRKELQRHFRERDAKGNKLGGKRTHFWADIYKSTQLGFITDRTADIDVGDSRFSQKVHGGTITAKTPWPGSGLLLLTIPVDPRAHGRRVSVTARETGLKLVFIGSAAGGVIGNFAKQAGQDQVFYACVPSVTQAPDPEALPDREKFEQVVVEAARKNLASQIKAGQTGGTGE